MGEEFAKSLGAIYDRLTRIETILETRADFEKRIRTLEHGQAEAKGRAMTTSVIYSALISLSVSVVGGLIIWNLKG